MTHLSLMKILLDLERLYEQMIQSEAWTTALKIKEIQAKILLSQEKKGPEKNILEEWTTTQLDSFLEQIENKLGKGK